MAVDPAALKAVALTQAEYDMIVERIGREPNHLELGIFGAMWSEHCGYKHSRPLLRQFPKRSDQASVLIEAGEENAGAVDIGDGLAVIMKVESHNHPSAIEPYEGAATGVGGIVRDIFTMGARPIALLNSLRFGPLDDPRNRHLFNGVVAGISGYGNCLGIPDVAGEIVFGEPYSANPLVNAMCVGLAKHDELVRARASGVGNRLMIVGSDTGRDGIHGATFASVDLDESSVERRPAVQVGNPFMEKLLLEACLEVLQRDDLVGLQDLGAAGLTSSVTEAAEKGGAGVVIDTRKVPRREAGMTPYEVMLSESQERMLAIVKRGHEDAVAAHFERWGLHAAVIGEVTDSGRLVVTDGDTVVADLPVPILADAPTYTDEIVRPEYLNALAPIGDLPEIDPTNALLTLLRSPNIASKRAVYRQYDHQVQNNTVVLPGAGDAAILRVKGTQRGIALAIDGNGRQTYLDPYAGGARAVAEAARNVVCGGARPIALTNCLNFANPERSAVYYQLAEAIRGMADAARALGLPVISGNVSLYNESETSAVYPTPVVGMLGLLENIDHRLDAAFKSSGAAIVLLGETGVPGLAGSEYLERLCGRVVGTPTIDLQLEARVQRLVVDAAPLLESAHDCADGGLAVAIAESCILGGQGAAVDPHDTDANALFGEAASRIVVSVAENRLTELLALAEKENVPARRIGTVGGDWLRIGPIELPLDAVRHGWETALTEAARGET